MWLFQSASGVVPAVLAVLLSFPPAAGFEERALDCGAALFGVDDGGVLLDVAVLTSPVRKFVVRLSATPLEDMRTDCADMSLDLPLGAAA